MKTITITEKTFNELFDKALSKFDYDGYWMNNEEKFDEFKLSRTYKLLQQTKSEIKHLKNELLRLE